MPPATHLSTRQPQCRFFFFAASTTTFSCLPPSSPPPLYCLQVDYQVQQDNTVTLRERDTMTQVRVLSLRSGGGSGNVGAAGLRLQGVTAQLNFVWQWKRGAV